MFVSKKRVAAVVVLIAAMVGAGAGWFFYPEAAAAPPEQARTPEALPDGSGKRNDEQMGKEVALLEQQLQRAMARVAALEARLAAPGERRQEVFYQGKSASFWIDRLKDCDPVYRTQAVAALQAIQKVDKTVNAALVRALWDRDEKIAELASNALMNGIDQETVHRLLQDLEGGSERHQFLVVRTLSYSEGDIKEVVPAMIERLKGKETDRRTGAASVLGRIGPDAKAAVPALMELLKDPASIECCCAVKALEMIGPNARAAVPALVELLKDTRTLTFEQEGQAFILPFVEGYPPPFKCHIIPAALAACALGGIGPDARAALPALRQAAQAEEPRVQREAKEAIAKIAPKSAPGGKAP